MPNKNNQQSNTSNALNRSENHCMTTRSRAQILDGVSAVDDDFKATSHIMMTVVTDDAKFMDQILVNCSKLEKKKKTGQSEKKKKGCRPENDVNEDDLRSIIRGLLPVPINSDSQKQSLHRQQVQSLFCLAKTNINDKPMVNVTNDRRFLVNKDNHRRLPTEGLFSTSKPVGEKEEE